ncbi:LLM class F420-dependent oxidoreductase [Nonomuraea sp. NPDC050556]|uniref:LLM class F420-dependent oxidoreductase n=1 Tax=Nonomuraea sp. NPDC050556 TaxID=3364369 RepID=UPI0037A79B39
MDGRIGVWHGLFTRAPAREVRAAAVEIENLGYGTLWLSEAPGTKDPYAGAAVMLAATERIAVGTGIANIWARDATATAAASATLAEAFPGRFILGLGVSHGTIVTSRGHDYAKPLSAMRTYLDDMDSAEVDLPRPERPAPRLLAALRPRMLELARDRADGVHPYLVPVEHTGLAREIIGPDKLLVPEQAVVVEPDPVRARGLAREHLAYYLTLPNYVNNWREFGFTDNDFSGGGSDRLVDALVVWGDAETIAKRVHAHLDAGADHVALQPLTPRGSTLAEVTTALHTLAPALSL